MINSVIHLVDDASMGGVNRLLENLENADGGFTLDHHKIVRVKRGMAKAPKLNADVIVSHMSISWANLPFFTSLRAAHPDTPMVHVEHSYSERFVALNVEKRARFDDLLGVCYALFDRIVAVSEPQASWLARRKFCLSDQIVTIPSCVKLQRCFDIRDCKPDGPLAIAAIGRLHPQKGFDILIEAFVKLCNPEIVLQIVGDGPERSALEKIAAGNKNIIFRGAMDNIALALAECDIVAMPSRWEPYGLVALEAMAAGRPVLCSKVDGLNQHISKGAIAVPENTVAGWVTMFQSLTSREVVERLPIGKTAIKAEWQFIHAWNSLVRKLLSEDAGNQLAA